MKKMIAYAAFMAVTFSAFAQDTTYPAPAAPSMMREPGEPGVHVGIRAGATLANVSKAGEGTDFSKNTKVGFTGGLFIDLSLASIFSIQPEVLYTQKGFKTNGTYLGNPYEYKQTNTFIDVPVLAKIKPSRNFALLVGPQFSFLTSTKTKFTTANTSYETLVQADNDNLKKNIVGGVIGLEAWAGNFLVDLRYSRDFQANRGDGTSTTPRYKNNAASLTIGFVF